MVDPFLNMTLDGRYTVTERIGEGAMAVVYKGRHENLARDVAIKILKSTKQDDLVARFRREAKVVSRLTSPNTVQVYDFGESGNTLYIAMEYLEGTPLDAEIEKGRLDARRVLTILDEVCNSLEEAHALGMIHRDMKPANIFLDQRSRREVAKVLDFGIAKVTQNSAGGMMGFTNQLTTVGAVMGTPTYMAPEQAKDKPLDARSDLYSLGVVAYHCLAGKPPFEGPPGKVIFQHVNKQPAPLSSLLPPVDVDPAVESLVMRLMSKDPEHRPQNVGILRDEIAALLGTTPSGATSLPPPRHGTIAPPPANAPRASGSSLGFGVKVIVVAAAAGIAAGAFYFAWEHVQSRKRPSTLPGLTTAETPVPPGFVDVPVGE